MDQRHYQINTHFKQSPSSHQGMCFAVLRDHSLQDHSPGTLRDQSLWAQFEDQFAKRGWHGTSCTNQKTQTSQAAKRSAKQPKRPQLEGAGPLKVCQSSPSLSKQIAPLGPKKSWAPSSRPNLAHLRSEELGTKVDCWRSTIFLCDMQNTTRQLLPQEEHNI